MPRGSGALSGCVSGLLALGLCWVHALAGAQTEAPPMPALGQFSHNNPFDPNRKLWPDRTPLPPPPPAPAPVTDADLEVYGVVMAGGAQKALLKLGRRFEGVPVGPSGIAVVPVGAQLGEFVLTQMTPDQILLKAPGGEQWIRFSLKKDRVSGARAGQQVPAAASSSAQTQVFGAPAVAPLGPPVANASTGANASAFGGTANAPGNHTAPPPNGIPIVPTGSAVQGGQGDPSTTASPAGSLAAAIMAAQAAQKAAGAEGGLPPAPPPGVNPFEALFQQQKK